MDEETPAEEIASLLGLTDAAIYKTIRVGHLRETRALLRSIEAVIEQHMREPDA